MFAQEIELERRESSVILLLSDRGHGQKPA